MRLTADARLPAPSCSTSSCCRTSSEPTGIGEFWGYPESRAFAELLIDCEDRMLRAVLVGMLREADRGRLGPIAHGIQKPATGTSAARHESRYQSSG
jgi:hypothetical protein